MDNPIQRVARAIMVARGGCEVTDWREAERNPNVEQALKEARAAVEAMRLTTWAMEVAGRDALCDSLDDDASTFDAKHAYSAMIDSALVQS